MAKFDMYEHYEVQALSEEESERKWRIEDLREDLRSAIAGLESIAREYEDVLDYDASDDICEAIQYLKDTERRLRG